MDGRVARRREAFELRANPARTPRRASVRHAVLRVRDDGDPVVHRLRCSAVPAPCGCGRRLATSPGRATTTLALEIGGDERDGRAAFREHVSARTERPERRGGTHLCSPFAYARRRAGGPTDLTGAAARISGMDLPAWFRRTLGTRCVRVVTSAPGSGARRPDRPRTSRPSSARTGRRRGVLPSSSSTTRPPRRTSPRRPSSPRSATSIASTAGGRSGRGCTGSSSTVRSTGHVRARCAPSSSWSTPLRRRHRPTSARTSSTRSAACPRSTAP